MVEYTRGGKDCTMPLVDLTEVLRPARLGRYAVGAFNVVDLTMLQAVLATAEARKSPLILSVAEVHMKRLDLTDLIEAAKRRARNSPLPVVLHLDHGTDPGTITWAIDNGFSSVMIDASAQDLAANIALTAAVAGKAHAAGVTVEAELGHVAGGEGSVQGSEVATALFTVPEQAAEFVARTGVDALAVAIGSVHGPYRQTPKLRHDILAEIARLVTVPLVLHGGPGSRTPRSRRPSRAV